MTDKNDTTQMIELPRLARDLQASDITLSREPDKATQISFSASSEAPVVRAWGTEVLDHQAKSVRMGRIETGAAPLLFNHDWDDPIGMVRQGRLADGRLHIDAQLFDTQRSREVRSMIDGGLKNVSIGYEIHALEENARANEFRAIDWEPVEVSLVTVPADPSIGIGRAADHEYKPVRITRAHSTTAQTAEPKERSEMDKDTMPAPAAEATEKTHIISDVREHPSMDFGEIERRRKESISKLARANNVGSEVENHWIKTGADMNKVADDLLEILEERGKQSDAPAMIGMSKKEVRQYSIMKAIRAALSNNWSKAGLELEAHRSLEARDGLQTREERSFFVPMDVQARAPVYATRDFNVAGAGNLVATDHLAGSFIDLLRNQSVVMGSGATRLTGLRGNVAIPKMTAGSTAYWLASETTAITESQPTIGQLTLSPKNVAALTEISHQMLQQGDPSAEQLVLNDLAASVALAADLGALAGDGTGGAPTGIISTAGIGTGFDPGVAALDYTHVLAAQTDVVKSNAMVGNMAYVCDPDTTAKLMTRVKFTGTASPIWDGNILMGDCAGFPGRTSNQMAADTALFGAWSSLVMAEWGVLELAVNPNQNFAAGLTGLRAWYTMDVGLRYAAAFSYANGIT